MERKDIGQMIEEKGFIEEAISPELKLVDEINRLKKRKKCGHPLPLLRGERPSGYC